jgi:broad specificity phosphatase PhoE
VIVLARHGETPFNAEGRFQGHLPVPLSPRGVEQAHALAAVAAQRPWAAYFSSPLERARETAAIVGAAIGMTPQEDPRLAETETGEWTGRSFADVRAEAPEAFAAWERQDADFAFPGGESFHEQTERVVAALEDIGRGPAPALVVCHRQVIRLALFARTGDTAMRNHPIENASLVELPAA